MLQAQLPILRSYLWHLDCGEFLPEEVNDYGDIVFLALESDNTSLTK